MDIPAIIDQLNQIDETTRIEAKRGSAIGPSIIESAIAFANEPRLDGGYILLGVVRDAEVPPTYSVVGVENPEQLQNDFSSQCASMLNRRLRPEIETTYIDEKPVVGIYVPESPVSEKPIYLESEGLPRGAFRRIGAADHRCNDNDLREIYEDESRSSHDASVVPDAEREDLDLAALEDYRATRTQFNPNAEELKWSDEDLLQALKGLRKDHNGALRPTVSGVLLFGSQVALRRLFPLAARIDYMRVPGTEWMEDPDRRFIHNIEIRAPLMQAIRRAQAAVLDDLPKSFSLAEGNLQRIDEPRIPQKALREAIVNAVMHRDYRRNSAVQIIRYANRVEIRNPGYSLVARDQLNAPNSETRNPAVANVLSDTRFAETKGTGIGVIRREMKRAGLETPQFETSREANRFVTTLYLHHFLDPEDIGWLAQFKDLRLSKAQVRGLVHAREEGRIDNETYRELNGIRDTLKASQDLRGLRKAGLLEMKEQSTATYYVPTEKLLAAPTDEKQTELPFDGGTSRAEDEPLQGQGQTLQGESEISGVEDETLQGEEQTLQGGDETLQDVLPETLKATLQDLGAQVPQDDLRNLIQKLCRWRALSARELASLLNKNRYYIAQEHIGPMVEAGRLKRTIPEKPTHRNQKYRATAPANE